MDLDKEVIIKEMDTNEFKEFINNLNLLPEDEILAKLPQFYKYYSSCLWWEKKSIKNI